MSMSSMNSNSSNMFNGFYLSLFSLLIFLFSNIFVINNADISRNNNNNFVLSDKFQNKINNFGSAASQSQNGVSDDVFLGNLGNGCTTDDMVFFQNYITQLMDMITIDQNAGELTEDLYILGYIMLRQNFSFSLFYEDGTPLFVFAGRDMYLFGEVYAFIPDLFWLWFLPGYATCEQVSPTVTRAVYRQRGGDFLRAVEGNVIVLVEFEWHWERDILGDDEDGFVWWRALNYSGTAITDFGVFDPTISVGNSSESE